MWALIRGKPFLCLHDETRANLKDATVHQDPKRWAFGRRYEASPSSVCVMRLLPTVRMQPYTRILNAGLVDVVQKRVPDFCFFLRDETCANCRDADCTPGSQALGLWASFDGEPFLCLNRETYQHRTGACGTMLHHLRTRASHLMYCTGTALVGPCCTICAREQATIRPRESVEPCCVEGASHMITAAQTITSTLETFLPGMKHHVAASISAVGAVDVLPRRAHNEQQEKHEFTS